MLTLLAIPAIILALYLFIEFHTAVAQVSGSIQVPRLQAAVQILRDDRDIPHIRAANEHDLFLAQGFAEGSDRLFQMDLTRHFVYGRLAEWFGPQAIASDERSRNIDVRTVVQRQYERLNPMQSAMLSAFADGVNAAMQKQPLPFEYRLLFVRPQPWSAQDSLAVGFATVLNLADPYQDVLKRDVVYRLRGPNGYDAAYPLTDPKYDVPLVGEKRTAQSTPQRARGEAGSEPLPLGSNAWTAGAALTAGGHALLANDPHLDLSIPGIWYLVDLKAPGYHAAGASLAGTPGVILGHNDALAWGATNGTVAALSVFRAVRPARGVAETFGVHFGTPVSQTYYRDARGFYITRGARSYLVAWSAVTNPRSPLIAFDGLDRAHSMEDALRALSSYPGPTQNFVVAARDGRAAYALAGWIPNDPLWGRRVHDEPYRDFAPLSFATLPHVAPSRNALVFTANNKMYADAYPFRLSPTFAPPYRAYRIRQLLHEANQKFSAAYFSGMQQDTLSIAELELAKLVVAAARRRPALLEPTERKAVEELKNWNGRMSPDSRAATIAYAMRLYAIENDPSGNTTSLLVGAREEARRPSEASDRVLLRKTLGFLRDPNAATEPWGAAGALHMLNPLSSLGIPWLNGPTLPGNGDTYSIHVLGKNFSQSFRAVWDAGNWDAGGIVIPAGESGEPGSPHYADLASTYVKGTLVPLPYTDAAVAARTVTRLTLAP